MLTALLAPTWPGTLLVAVAAIALIVGAARIRPRVLLAAMSAPIVFLILGAISVLFSVGTAPADAWWHAAFLSVGVPRWPRPPGCSPTACRARWR